MTNFSVSQAISESFKTLNERPFKFIGLFFLMNMVGIVILVGGIMLSMPWFVDAIASGDTTAIPQIDKSNPMATLKLVSGFYVVMLVYYVYFYVVFCGMAKMSLDAIDGKDFGLGCFRMNWKRYLFPAVSYIIIGTVIYFATIIAMLIGVLLGVILGHAFFALILALIVTAYFGVLIYACLRFFPILYLCIEDGLDPIQAMKESWRITQGNAVNNLVAFASIYIIVLLPYLLALAALGLHMSTAFLVLFILFYIWAIYAGPWFSIAHAMLYRYNAYEEGEDDDEEPETAETE